jgi:hypothetical protein
LAPHAGVSVAFNKNEDDTPPAFAVDLMPTEPPNTPLSALRRYQSEWTTDAALFGNAAARTPVNFWTGGVHQSQTRNFRVALPRARWESFKVLNRHLYHRIRVGTAQDMSSWLANWQWSDISDILTNHNPRADAGPARRAPIRAGTVTSAIVLDGSGSSDSDAGSTLIYSWTLVSAPSTCFDQAALASATRVRRLGDGGDPARGGRERASAPVDEHANSAECPHNFPGSRDRSQCRPPTAADGGQFQQVTYSQQSEGRS